MSEYGYFYNVIQTNGEGWGVLDVMNSYQHHGYETFGSMVDKKTGVLCLLVRKPMTADERADANLKHIMDERRRDEKARSK